VLRDLKKFTVSSLNQVYAIIRDVFAFRMI